MNWYKKALKTRSIEEASRWVKQYVAKTKGGRECLVHGDCDMFVDDFMIFLNGAGEVWALYEIYDKNLSDQLPFINTQSAKIIGEDTPLCDIGAEAHLVVKWMGFWWDGYGKQTVEQIMQHFDKIKNPHWFRT